MPFTKPVVLPEFAKLDIGNGPLGALNVQTPDTDHKDYGWDYGEAPPREYFNWLARLQYEWTGWTDQEVEAMKIIIASLENNTRNTRMLFQSQW